MLDMGANLESSGVGPCDPLGRRLPRLALLLDEAVEHNSRQEGLVFLQPVGRVGPGARAGIGPADWVWPSSTIIGIDGAGAPSADQAVG